MKINVAFIALKEIPENIAGDILKSYLQSLIETIAGLQFLLQEIWQQIRQKYNLCECATLDMGNGEIILNGNHN